MGDADCSIDLTGAGAVYTRILDPSLYTPGEEFYTPLGRIGHTLVACTSHHLYMFGGYNPDLGATNAFWLYDTHTRDWQQVQATEAPSPR